MAKQLSFICIDSINSDENGVLVPALRQTISYQIVDDATGMKGGGRIQADEINPSDTIAQWWIKIQNQIKAAEGMS